MSATKINTVLTGSDSLRALVSDRVYLAPAPQGTKTPFVTYEFSGDDPFKDISGAITFNRQEWTITATSGSYLTAENTKNLVVAVMAQEVTEFRASHQSTEYEFDEDSENHRFEITFTIMYR